MRAAHAYGWLYDQLTGRLDEEKKMKVDVILGMPGAQASLDTHRHESVAAAGYEVVT